MESLAYLNALKAFEASARHRSFSAAGVELNVTAAAVGQQVRTLEAWLGVPLFIRAATGPARLTPTDAAMRALPDIRLGFDHLITGIRRLREAAHGTVLTVTVSPAFAAKWLLPRIDRFQSRHPGVDLRLDTSQHPIDFVANGIDVGVRYGEGHWPGLVAIKLMDEDIFPVCSPALRDRVPELRVATDIARYTLIHDVTMGSNPALPTWRSWLDAAGHPEISSEHGLRINNSAAVLQAAAEGQGLALARSVMAADDLAAGRLVRPFENMPCPVALSYYVVYRPESDAATHVTAFRDWLLDEVTRAALSQRTQ
jgi:LysR family transcriptional regulator, glycine cleavage system transcriptional activator